MSRESPPLPPPTPSDGPTSAHDALLRAVAADEATVAEAAFVRRLAAGDPALAARLEAAEALEAALRSDALLPLPLGLVTRILDGMPPEVAGSGRERDGARVRASRPRSRREWVAIAAGAVLALGAGIGGLWTVAGSGDLRALVGAATDLASAPDANPVASLASLADEARTSTHTAVASLAAVPDRMPGSPAALGLCAVALLGAAAFGVRRSSASRSRSERAPGPASAGARRSEGSES